MSVTDDAKNKMLAVIDHLKEELKQIRSGKANPGMLDGVVVEVYGAPARLKEIASVTSPESRQILITPFDRNNASAISKAIEKANLGLQPMVDGNAVRIKIPPMDESMRKKMVTVCRDKCEKAKIGIRNTRRDCNNDLKKQKSDGEIAEDVVKKKEKEIQDLTDKYCKEADDMTRKKEEEVLTI
jgi:ribosome recycling factor